MIHLDIFDIIIYVSKQEHLLSPTTYLEKPGPIRRWSYPIGIFSYVLTQSRYVSNPIIRSDMSWEIDKYWLQRRSPNSLKTLSYLSESLQLVAKFNPDLVKTGEKILDKQQPSFIEAISETIARLKFLFTFTEQLPTAILSCISGGSMSYERFYNVRGGENPSDLDLIIVYENEEEENLVAANILPPELGFNPNDTRLLEERVRKFIELKRDGKADVLSQKASLIKQEFDVSMHMMSRETFYQSVLYNVFADLKNGADVDRRLLDYKPKPFKHQVMRQRNFNGDIEEFNADEIPVPNAIESTEVISRIPAYAIRSGLLVPGMYHNLISPRFEFEPFTSAKISSVVMLYWTLMQDLQKEYRKTNPKASVLRSHIRYDIFSKNLKETYE